MIVEGYFNWYLVRVMFNKDNVFINVIYVVGFVISFV